MKSRWASYGAEHPERAAYYKSAHWRIRRAEHLKANPTCVVCGGVATHVDHVVPLAERGDIEGRLQSMCAEHHKAKTLADSHRGMKRNAKRRRNQ